MNIVTERKWIFIPGIINKRNGKIDTFMTIEEYAINHLLLYYHKYDRRISIGDFLMHRLLSYVNLSHVCY